MNCFGVITLTMIGIKEWFAPQISEHWPENKPIRFGVLNTWLTRPGRASTLDPSDGTVHEWITSSDETNIRFVELIGIFTNSLVFSNRTIFEGSINLSISFAFTDIYS